MRIKYSARFLRHYRQRIKPYPELQAALKEAVDNLFHNNLDLLTHNHPLLGSMQGLAAFSLNTDYRVIYKSLKDGYLLLDVGTHRQVYID